MKLAVKRLLEGKNRSERSGIIWHTQGSGKSLTMMFMVREMRQHVALAGWKVVFVTDRTQLEDQLSETSQSIGLTVKVADSIAKLKELIRNDSSDLVMAMIQKFQEPDLQEMFPAVESQPEDPADDRRGAPFAIQAARRQPRPRHAPSRPHRLHRHAD